jgi:NAD(P)-dependent dehydrogenase (short-subunit alcohol dehydrogenase family)
MNDLFSLQGKSAVVVGAGGMGNAIAGGLAHYGAQTAVADVNPATLEQAAREIETATGQKVRAYEVDCTLEASVEELATKTVSDLGRVDILVNALGYNFKAPATEFPIDQWDRLFAINVRGVMICCKVFGARMVEQGSGKIINLSSVRGQRGTGGGNSAYCATKGAVDMITRQLACELAPHGVFVNAIAPIITVTPMTEQRIKDEAARYERMLQNVPMGRMAAVADIVGPVVFLASAASDFVTGTILNIDGGNMAYA